MLSVMQRNLCREIRCVRRRDGVGLRRMDAAILEKEAILLPDWFSQRGLAPHLHRAHAGHAQIHSRLSREECRAGSWFRKARH
jgi:hypothetical protein